MTYKEIIKLQERLKVWRPVSITAKKEIERTRVEYILRNICEFEYCCNDKLKHCLDDEFHIIEQVKAISSIIINCLYTFISYEIDEEQFEINMQKIQNKDISKNIGEIIYIVSFFKKRTIPHQENFFIKGEIEKIIVNCIKIIEQLGYDPYIAVDEIMDEIASKKGYWDYDLDKFIEYQGFYDEKDLLERILQVEAIQDPDCDKLMWYLNPLRIDERERIYKWHRPDFTKAKRK